MSQLCANSLWIWRRKCLAGPCNALLPQHVEITTCQTKVLLYFHLYDALWILLHILCLQLTQYFQLKCILAVSAFLKDNYLLGKTKLRYSLNTVLLKANPTFCYYITNLGTCSASEPLVHEIPSCCVWWTVLLTESPLTGGEWVELNVGDFQMEMDGTAKLPAFQLSIGIQKPKI